MAEIVPEKERGETSYEEEVEYYNQTHPVSSSSPDPAEQDAQQRKQARDLKELEDSQYGSEREEQEGEVTHFREQHPERSTRDKLFTAKERMKKDASAVWGALTKKRPEPPTPATREKAAPGKAPVRARKRPPGKGGRGCRAARSGLPVNTTLPSHPRPLGC